MIDFAPALCTVTFRGLEPERIVELAASAGLSAIEWAGDVHVPPGSHKEALAALRLSHDAGLAVSYGSYVAPPSDDLDTFVEALDTATLIGAQNIRIWPGTRNRDSVEYTAEELSATALEIRAMGEIAAARGIAVSLEYHPGSLTDRTEAAERLIDAVASENVYLYWQPRPGLALDAAIEEIERIGPHVSHVHVFAWDEARTRFPLAAAEGYWRDVFAALPASRWNGTRYAMLEFVRDDDPAAFIEDAQTLKRILA